MIILGVDPGLTRCGVGVIEAGEHRRLSFIHVDVVRSSPDITQDLRLLAIYNGLSEKMDRFAPDAVSIERVFAQSNRNTVLGTAQAAGLAMLYKLEQLTIELISLNREIIRLTQEFEQWLQK